MTGHGATIPRAAEPHRSESRRLWLMAAATAVAVHGLLLGLFRYAPRVNPPESDELPAVGAIDLAVPGNAALAQWMAIHDPALVTAPNVTNGYSMVMSIPVFRRGLEDLPHPPVLTVPGTTKSTVPEMVLNTEPPALLRAVRTPWRPESPVSTRVRVTLNGRELPGLSGELTRWRNARSKSDKVLPAAGMITEIELGPSRIPGLGRRMRLVRSCGKPEFDRRALGCLEAGPAGGGDSGTVAVDWGRTNEQDAAQ